MVQKSRQEPSQSLQRMKGVQVGPADSQQGSQQGSLALAKQTFRNSPKLSTILSMADRPQLHSYFHSSCCWRVRIALNLACIEVDQVPVHLARNGGEQHCQEYKQLNPMAQVPTLEIDGLVLTQSVAIMEYIHDTHPEVNILPKDPNMKVKVRMITELICSGIQPMQNLSVMQKHSTDSEERMRWSQHWVRLGLAALETMLTKTAGDCCVGDDVTMADCCLVPQVYNATRFSVDVSEFPTISRVTDHLNTLPEFIAAHPLCQPDCPPELMVVKIIDLENKEKSEKKEELARNTRVESLKKGRDDHIKKNRDEPAKKSKEDAAKKSNGSHKEKDDSLKKGDHSRYHNTCKDGRTSQGHQSITN